MRRGFMTKPVPVTFLSHSKRPLYRAALIAGIPAGKAVAETGAGIDVDTIDVGQLVRNITDHRIEIVGDRVHRWMVAVDLVDHVGNIVDRVPDAHIVASVSTSLPIPQANSAGWSLSSLTPAIKHRPKTAFAAPYSASEFFIRFK